jgi:Protein of unknown function (DUF3052)
MMQRSRRDDAPSSKPLLDKLGVRPEHRIAVIGIGDPLFVALLRGRAGDVTTGRAKDDTDLVFYGVSDVRALGRLAILRGKLVQNGAIWVIRPKGGGTDVTESDVMAAGKDAGLVDTKVVAFSETHSALKFVIPVRDRRRAR